MNIFTVYKQMEKKAAWELPAGSNQYLRYQNPSGNYNGMTTTPYEQTPSNIKPATTEKKPYGNPAWKNQPEWGAPEGYSNKSWFGQIGDNFKNWSDQGSWDFNHAIDTLFGTKLTYGKKRPTDESYGGSFWKAINPFGQKPYTETQVRKQTDWQKRMMAEQNGDKIKVNKNSDYNRAIYLPENQVFQRMANEEALGQQYDQLRARGMSNEQIANYVMKEKYLPLVRDVTGKQNINSSMKLTDENWNTIKSKMLDRQMNGVKQNLEKVDPNTGFSNKEYNSELYNKDYQDALKNSMDAKVDALRKGQDPAKTKVTYSDVINNNKAMQDAVNKATKNNW